jgi:hypothetical protein
MSPLMISIFILVNFNAGKNIDQVFSEYQERQKMQAVENWLKYCKRPLPKCFKEFIEKQAEGEKDRLREIYTNNLSAQRLDFSCRLRAFY